MLIFGYPHHHWRTVDGFKTYFFKSSYVKKAIRQALIEFQMQEHHNNGDYSGATMQGVNNMVEKAGEKADKFMKGDKH